MNDGGPAFPNKGFNDALYRGGIGMSLRDYLAAKAMQGLLAHDGHDSSFNNLKILINDAFVIADAMIAESSKKD